jgi:hypothetical protein
MVQFSHAILFALRLFLRTRRDTALEILTIRQQVAVFRGQRPRSPLNPCDRLSWTTLRRWADVLLIVKSETVVGWHCAGFSPLLALAIPIAGRAGPHHPGASGFDRPTGEREPDWGAPKIHAELQKLGSVIAERCVARYPRCIVRRGDRIRNGWPSCRTIAT